MNNFLNLLTSNPDQYIGYGNPSADVCFVGKEATGMIEFKDKRLGYVEYWKKSLPMFFDRIKDENPCDPIWKEGHTWNKYQKLHDVIFPEHAAKQGTMNFEQRVFVTEMSVNPATTTAVGRSTEGFDEKLAQRKQSFFSHPYFKEFKVIVLACSDYIVNFGDRREIDTLFDVTFDMSGGAHEIGPQNAFWVHHDASGERMVIHTRQLSGAVSDKMLEEMGSVIRQHLEKNTNSVQPPLVSGTQGEVSVGMTMDECRKIWGEPKDVNKTTMGNDKFEHWHYPQYKRLSFKNGRLFIINE